MQILTFPSALSNADLELLKTSFEGFQFPAFAAGFGMLDGEVLQVGANQSCEGGITFDGDLAGFLDQVLIDGKGYIHEPIIRVTLIMCNK